MARTVTVTLDDGTQHTYQNIPDDVTPDQVSKRASSDFNKTVTHIDGGRSSPAQQSISDVPQAPMQAAQEAPISPPASPAEFDARKAATNEPSLYEKVKGAGETALAIGTGSTTGMLGNMAGAIHGIGKSMINGTYGTQAGADAAQQEAESTGANLTYSPKTATGQQYLQNAGDILSPLAAIAPATAELGIIGQSAKAAMPIAEATIRNEASLFKPGINPEKLNVINKIKSGDTDNSLAALELKVENPKLKDAQGNLLPEAYKVVPDDVAKETIKQGFNDGIVQAVKTTDNYNAKKMLGMLNVSEKGKKNSVFGSENRPTDGIGDSLAQNIGFLKRTNKVAGQEIDASAKSLAGQSVDVSTPVDKFISDLADKAGVQIVRDQSGKIRPIFKGSDIEGEMYKPEQRLISMIVDRMGSTKAPDAYDVHRMKRAIDQTVTYGKSNSKALWPSVENSVKGLRNGLDQTLDDNFPSYNKANQKYSDTIQALNSVQDAVGRKVDLFGEGADKQLGISMRSLLSNNKSRQALTDSIKQIQDTSKKYGNAAPDDIMAQVTFANELDNMFGPAAKSSLAGEQSSGTKAALRDMSQAHGIYDLAARGIQAGADKVRGVNQTNAYQSMRDLLTKQARKTQEAQQ